ncbi:MAG: hypothetical protein Q4C57_11000, partial [Bacillota bacterium]|nr:hypothetical protein [Bacillota bacterium]
KLWIFICLNLWKIVYHLHVYCSSSFYLFEKLVKAYNRNIKTSLGYTLYYCLRKQFIIFLSSIVGMASKTFAMVLGTIATIPMPTFLVFGFIIDLGFTKVF